MRVPVHTGIYRNGKVVSQSPNKKFALVNINGTSYMASKSSTDELEKGTTVVVEFIDRNHVLIL